MVRKGIDFILNDTRLFISVGELERLSPVCTVLDWLRHHLTLEGSKVGCGHGDCGACTVVLAEPDSKGVMHYRAVNSCLLYLPMLHGKQLITIEGVTPRDGSLHPIQTALMEHRGVQCGFCTPGMVMSLFALCHERRSEEPLSAEEIGDALAGNLCRCTGYHSIVDSALSIPAFVDSFHDKEAEVAALLKSYRENKVAMWVDTPEVRYVKVRTESDLLHFHRLYPEAVVVSGATDVAVLREKGAINPSILIDRSDLEQSAEVDIRCSTYEVTVTVPAGITVETFKQAVTPLIPSVGEYLNHFGSKQIRNRATVGGSLASSSPIGDLMPIFLALNATIHLVSFENKRSVLAETFNVDYHRNVMAPDELLEGISFTLPRDTSHWLFAAYKVARRCDMDISTVSMAAFMRFEGCVIREARIAFGGMAAVPLRLPKVEKCFVDQDFDKSVFDSAQAVVRTTLLPISDVRASSEYRLEVAGNLITRLYHEFDNFDFDSKGQIYDTK